MKKTLNIELFTTNACQRCHKAKRRLKTVIDEYAANLDESLACNTINYSELDVVEQLDYAVYLGILTTPAIAFNGKLVFSATPSTKQLSDEIIRHFTQHKEEGLT